ncbi:MAG TPA: DUF1697 domain-containing protein [Micromonosporaceae bacterium]|nr:DUF1697 domain-containing protein [Micromonosporaceae bacterium]
MARYAALLRGINVGGNKKIAMAELRRFLSDLGYTDVATHLQSGNAVFTSKRKPDKLATEIEKGIEREFGMTVRCLVRTGPELRKALDGSPFRDVATNGSRMLVHFLSASPAPKLLAAHDPTQLAPDEIAIGDRVVYQWCPNGIQGAPPVSAFVEKNLKVFVTARNWNTVTKLCELLDT